MPAEVQTYTFYTYYYTEPEPGDYQITECKAGSRQRAQEILCEGMAADWEDGETDRDFVGYAERKDVPEPGETIFVEHPKWESKKP